MALGGAAAGCVECQGRPQGQDDQSQRVRGWLQTALHFILAHMILVHEAIVKIQVNHNKSPQVYICSTLPEEDIIENCSSHLLRITLMHRNL